jgi:hypothetical protein
LKRTILILSIIVFQCTSIPETPRIEIDISTCRHILNLFRMMHETQDRPAIDRKLTDILDSRTYRTMFTHYNRSWRPNHLPPDVFKRMILSLKFHDAYEAGDNQRADQMLPQWETYYSDLEMFENRVEELEDLDLKVIIEEAIAVAHAWLPKEMRIEDFYVTIHPNGGSGAFAIGDAQGYDFFRLARDASGSIQTEVLAEIAAHECHHLALDIPYPTLRGQTDSLAFEFLSVFVGEGTATKFINNADGGTVPRIDPIRSNTIMDPSTNDLTKPLWTQYTKHENLIFQRMGSTLLEIVEGKMDRAAYEEEIRDYWITGMIGRNYFIGAELFGAIYIGLGKQACFDVIRDPRQMFKMYNRAVQSKPDLLNQCPIIPDKVIQSALGIR